MPLPFAPEGREVTVVKVTADEKTKRHLANLGLVSGGKVEVISSRGGEIVVKILNSRVVLNRQLSLKILVA